jgi:hypothetical protein
MVATVVIAEIEAMGTGMVEVRAAQMRTTAVRTMATRPAETDTANIRRVEIEPLQILHAKIAMAKRQIREGGMTASRLYARVGAPWVGHTIGECGLIQQTEDHFDRPF